MHENIRLNDLIIVKYTSKKLTLFYTFQIPWNAGETDPLPSLPWNVYPGIHFHPYLGMFIK